MSRVRLTARDRAAADQTPYPGNVNQPDRTDPSWEQYHTFEQRVNHELPDMRHEWQNDSRDDIGFGIPEDWGKTPTVASVRVAANKAVRISMLLLGEKVDDEVIEAQARDFMSMGHTAMDRTMKRFADTQKLYAEDESKKDDEKEVKAEDKKDDEKEVKAEDKKEEKEVKADAAAPFTPEIAKPGAEVTAADEKKDDEKACTASQIEAIVAKALAAALPEFLKKKEDEKKASDESDKKDEKEVKAEDKKDDEKEVKAEDKKEEKSDEKKAADDKSDEKKDEKTAADDKKDEKDEEKTASAPRSATEFDIELTGSMDDELAEDKVADERLASLFDDGLTASSSDKETSSRKAEASQKAGIKKLGGQPRVATASGSGVDISSIWQSAPDVSEAFR